MTVVVDTYPLRTSLVDLTVLRRELAAPESADAVLPSMARQATAAIESYCKRTFARGAYTETIPGFGSPLLMLHYTPLVLVSAVTGDSSPILDYIVDNADAGFLYRERGWDWSYGGVWILDQSRAPGGESRPFAVTYTAGYLVPEDDVADATLSVLAADQSFNRATGVFPLLVPGDRFESAEFANAANNGTWTVLARTATKITVLEPGLVTEAAGATGANPKTLTVRTLPADIERAAVDAAKARYLGRARDPMLASRSITGLSISYATSGPGGGPLSLPPTSTALLAPYRRMA